MTKTKQQKVIDTLEKEAMKLRYLAESEDKPGLSEILMDIALNIECVKFSDYFDTDKGDNENGKTD